MFFKKLLAALCNVRFTQEPLDTFTFVLYLSPEDRALWPKALADLNDLLVLTGTKSSEPHLGIACRLDPWCNSISGKCTHELLYQVVSWSFEHGFHINTAI